RDRRVVHRHADLPADLRTGPDIDVGPRQGAVRGAYRAARIGIDARRPRRLTRRVHDAELVAHYQPDLDDGEDRQHQEGQHERERHRRLTAFLLTATVAPCSSASRAEEPTTPVHDGSTFAITESNSWEIAWLPVAHVMSNVAIATAP